MKTLEFALPNYQNHNLYIGKKKKIFSEISYDFEDIKIFKFSNSKFVYQILRSFFLKFFFSTS